MTLDADSMECVYCTIVVGESTWFLNDLREREDEFEPYAEMTEGPVCWSCVARYDLVKAAAERDKGQILQRMAAKRLRKLPRIVTSVDAPMPPEEQAERMRALYGSGLTQKEVAAQMGLSQTTVQRRMKQYHLPTRIGCPRGPRYGLDTRA